MQEQKDTKQLNFTGREEKQQSNLMSSALGLFFGNWKHSQFHLMIVRMLFKWLLR
uniref:Uncharacterized protein n=1 Tax=Arcella intermedia TaxID=1963864 RepID=A0A6B2LX44_9EUKA